MAFLNIFCNNSPTCNHVTVNEEILIKFKTLTKSCYGKGKVLPVLNYIPHHEDIWGSGGIVPHSLNIGTR
jgi:hypothetical protein